MRTAMRITVALVLLMTSAVAVMAAQRTCLVELFTNTG